MTPEVVLIASTTASSEEIIDWEFVSWSRCTFAMSPSTFGSADRASKIAIADSIVSCGGTSVPLCAGTGNWGAA
jgi:hypothetical protein